MTFAPPAGATPDALSAQDAEHLRLLAIFHRVLGGITLALGCIPMIHVAVGAAMLAGALPVGRREPFPVAFMGGFFVFAGLCAIIGLWTLGFFLFRAARCLDRRERYTLCLVVAAFSCAMAPLGTVLGVFTLVVLVRPAVKAAFDAGHPAAS